MNLAEFQDAVYGATGFPVNDGLITPTFVNSQVNRALRHIAGVKAWRWLQATDEDNEATVAAQAAYTLPTDYVSTRSLTIDSTPAREVTIDEYDAMAYADMRPTTWVYAVHGTQLLLYPTPQDVLTIVHRYLRSEKDLTSATMTPLLPAQYHDAVVARAAYTTLLRANDVTRAAQFRDEYELAEKRMLTASRSTAQRRVRVRSGGGL